MNIRKLHQVIVALMAVSLVLSACVTPMPAAPIQAPSTAATPAALASSAVDAEPLPMPRYVAPAYTTLGTRNADGTPGPNYWQNHSVHDIAIEVAPPGRTVTGTQTITYTNNSPNPLPMVVVRLYQNSRLPEAIREENHSPDFLTDGIQIEEFSVNGQVIPWATFDAILPFETVKLVPLPQPLLPGESATFAFKWHYDLGLEYNREGVFDPTTFFIGYFFPRISTYSDTDAGLLAGWDLEEYTYRSGRELHNDFADFNYSVTVPKNFLVWATGELQNPDEVLQPDAAQRLLASRTSDEIITIASPDDLQQGLITAQTDTVTWRWKAENISDVAVGVSDHYVWDAGSVVADPASDRRVSVHAAYAEELTDFETMAQDIKDIVASASSAWPGVPYPYSHATVFVGGGDEEFPMMANDGPDAGEGRTERFIAAHELLHNYFPFYMGIDERRYPFMDEGWTTAFEYLFNLEDIGKEAADALFIKMRSGNLVAPYPGEEIPVIVPADATRGLVTGNDGYVKPALAYLALKEYMGDDAFKTSLHAFMDRWHGKRPLPWDMFNTFDDTSDMELNWFFQNWFFESNYLDIAIGDVETVDGGYAIVVENVGGAAVPFDVKVVYADDSAESFRQGPDVWQDSPEEATVMITTDKELKSVTLDGGIFVDGNAADNTWSSEPVTATETAAPAAAAQVAEAPAESAASPADVTTSTFGTAWQSVSCDTFKVNATIAAGSDCGYVTVPLRHDELDGPTIQLGVVRIRSTGEEPSSDPLVMEQGGPGGSTIGFFPNQIRKLVEVLNQRDIVLVEQRGTQYSIPWLDCSAERNAHNIAVAKGEAEDDGSYLNACKANWDEQGIDLSAFNDAENAADIYSAVAALGYDQFNYYGVSYGTELGQHVMKVAADHPDVLRSVILDSVKPIDIQDFPLKDMIASQALRTMFENCAQDATCSQDFPDLEQKTLALLEQMNVTPVVVTATLPSGEKLPMPVTGSDLFQLMWSNLYSRQTIRQLPGILDTMIQKGDFSWVAKQKTEGLALTPGGMAEGMHLSMWCPRLGNEPFLGTDLFAPSYPQANLAELALPDYARRCQIMDVTSAEPADFVYPDADIPTLILSGAMDPATPPQYGAHVAENLKTAYAYTLPDTAHNVMLDSPTSCALNLAAAFLADPSQAPDSSCVKDLKPVFARRVTPLDEMTFEPRTVITGVTASIPTAFADPQGTGLYSDPADPINAPTGLIKFAVVAADTADAALASLKDSTVIAEDQAIGNYRWKIVESSTLMKGIIARGAATALPDGEHYLTIMLAGPENSADAIFATLLEPILSSVKAE